MSTLLLPPHPPPPPPPLPPFHLRDFRADIHLTQDDWEILTENGKLTGGVEMFSKQQFRAIMKGELWVRERTGGVVGGREKERERENTFVLIRHTHIYTHVHMYTWTRRQLPRSLARALSRSLSHTRMQAQNCWSA